MGPPRSGALGHAIVAASELALARRTGGETLQCSSISRRITRAKRSPVPSTSSIAALGRAKETHMLLLVRNHTVIAVTVCGFDKIKV